MKKLIIVLSILISSISFSKMREFTLKELSEYNGKNGKPVYVAVDGIVYDLTHLKKWKTGTHMGKLKAGQDVSKVKAPHGDKFMKRMKKVGVLKK